MDGTKECSSAGRTAVSKTARRGFESCHSCHHAEVVESGRHAILRGWWGKTRRSSNLRLGTRLQKGLSNRRGRNPAPAYALSIHRPILSAEVAKWQTRRSQKPLGITARVGSSPTFGTNSEAKKPRRPFDDSDLFCFSLRVRPGIGVSQCIADIWLSADWPMTNSNLPPTMF